MTREKSLQAALLTALFVLGGGCELIATVDRTKISEAGSGGEAGEGGTGGIPTTSTGGSETGGAGGTGAGGAGGTGGTGGSTCIPVDDDNECTEDTCDPDGATEHTPKPAGSACMTGGSQCDGGGACVACLAPADCPGADDACQMRTCVAGACGLDFAPAGTALPVQDAGDCKQLVCDGAGATVAEDDDDDLPDDRNACTDDLCTAGVPSNPARPQGADCGVSAGGAPLVCDGAALCVGCNAPADCPGADDECQARACVNQACGVVFTAQGTPVAAQAPGDCLEQVCDGAGNVVAAALDTDLPADDGNACTDDTCASGAPLHPAKANGTACSDGDACTQTDTCQAGACAGSAPVACAALDTCHTAGACDPATGQCSNPAKPDGASCDDGDGCTQTDTCASGACNGGDPVTCAALDQCHVAGACDPATGQCSNPARPNGASCDDGDGCTQADTCQSGACAGGAPVTCAALDQCHVAGACDPADGTCSNPAKPDGAGCDDGDGCTQADTCQSGACAAGAPVVCAPVDGCHVAGVCDPADGACSNPNEIDGTPCMDGMTAGACVNGVCGTCGDGVLQTGEQCDDGNFTSGDGCDVNCTLTGCGNGIATAGEPCDDGNLVNGDGCDVNCTVSACGNGIVAGAETCDDGNLLGSDGCGAKCQTEAPYTCTGSPSACVTAVEINCNDGKDNDGDGSIDCADTDCALGCDVNVGPCAAGEALLVYTAADTPKAIPDLNAIGVTSNITVGGFGLVKRVVMQTNITHPYDGDIDATLRSPGNLVTDVTSDNGGTGDNFTDTIFNTSCATSVTAGVAPFTGCYKPESPFTVHVNSQAKGVWAWNVADDATGDLGTVNSWRLALCVAQSTCGDAVVDPGEQCDDGNGASGDGCDANCTLTACGNGILATGEQCDDGNTADGDGCDANCKPTGCGNGVVTAGEACDDGNTLSSDGCDSACAIEATFTEIEPNGTLAEADANAAGGLVVTGTSTMIAGAITPTADKDIYKLILPASGVVRFETFDASGNDCTSANVPAAMKMSLLGSAGAVLYTDTTRGIGNCSAIVANMVAGTYYVQIEKNTSGTIAAYKLQVKVQASRGNEAEVNDTLATATSFPGSDVYIFGGHQVATDKDVFTIPVPAGKSIRAEIIEGSTAETCESQGIDSKIFLVSPGGVDLGSVDDVGRGYCSLMDGTGAAPVNAYARNVAGGTYAIRVEASNLCSGASCQFDYRLVVTIR